MEKKPKKQAPYSPQTLLENYVSTFIAENNLNASLKLEIPKKWEKYGDFLLFDSKAFSSDIWNLQNESFWLGICQIFKCKRLGIKSKIQNDGFRTPNVKIIVGNDPWIIHTDNAIKYTWNVENNMFSAGNAPERHRVAQLNCENETVVDLFAGIGYFTLPYLIHGKAEFVHACEWNPNAVEALKRNLKLNKIEDRCKVYEGDNRFLCPKKVADRVNLGLIPSSESSWKVACEALKPSGGILHIHGNVETKKLEILCEHCRKFIGDKLMSRKKIFMTSKSQEICEKDVEIHWKNDHWFFWGIHVLHTLISILMEMNEDETWRCSVENVHFVKSYAPHVHHLVLDVEVRATDT